MKLREPCTHCKTTMTPFGQPTLTDSRWRRHCSGSVQSSRRRSPLTQSRSRGRPAAACRTRLRRGRRPGAPKPSEEDHIAFHVLAFGGGHILLDDAAPPGGGRAWVASDLLLFACSRRATGRRSRPSRCRAGGRTGQGAELGIAAHLLLVSTPHLQ